MEADESPIVIVLLIYMLGIQRELYITMFLHMNADWLNHMYIKILVRTHKKKKWNEIIWWYDAVKHTQQ